jgi:Flp pilus assembly protein TadD
MRKGSFDVASAFQQALECHRTGQLTEAKAIYRRITKVDSTHFESQHLLGVVHHQLGDHKEALRQICLALKINPLSVPAHVNCGVVLQHLKRLDDALISYNRAIALEPNDPVSFYNRGNVLKSLQRLDDAVASCGASTGYSRSGQGG